jgi:hypothetical protein
MKNSIINSFRWELPIKVVSEANCSEHWTEKSKRHQRQQFFVRISYKKYVADVGKVNLPCKIKFTRLSPRSLDCEENLPMAFKWIKDEIGACLFPEKVVLYKKKSGKIASNKGHADSDPRVSWEFFQEKSKSYGIRIEIISLPDPKLSGTDHE